MRRIIYIILAAVLLLACEKKDEAFSSSKDRNWFIRVDSDDELDHYIYEVYKNTSVALLYTEILGEETRYNQVREPYIYYEKLKFGYNLQQWSPPGIYKLTDNREKILVAMKCMNEEVLPQIPENMRARAYLLTDTLNIMIGQQYWKNKTAYHDLLFTVVGQVYEMDTMATEARKSLVNDIVSVEKAAYLQEFYEDELKPFFMVTDSIKDARGTAMKLYAATLIKGTTSIIPEDYGFLRHIWVDTQINRAYTVDKKGDLGTYIALIAGKKDEDIRSEYASNPYVIEKYEILKQILEKFE